MSTLTLSAAPSDALAITAGLGSIKDSYAFDVKDKRQLMAHGTDVFIGEVLGAAETDYKLGSTLWRVRVVRSIKGSPSGEVQVRQLGSPGPPPASPSSHPPTSSSSWRSTATP